MAIEDDDRPRKKVTQFIQVVEVRARFLLTSSRIRASLVRDDVVRGQRADKQQDGQETAVPN